MSSDIRAIDHIWQSVPTLEGAGVHLRRAFGFDEVPQLDPFLLLDDFRGDNPNQYLPGFPWHPHRGIETITYMIEGEVDHGDSMGNAGIIYPGDVQWMTAGSGVIHQEMPRGNKQGRMGGFQLWANLPRSHKMMDPRYRGITAEQIPMVTLSSGAEAKIVSGTLEGVTGPVTDIVTDPEYLDVSVPPDTVFEHATKPGHTVLAYVYQGQAYFDECRDAFSHEETHQRYFDLKREGVVHSEHVVLYAREGDRITVTTRAEPMKFLLVSGQPLGEPVAWWGPIVMNTKDELRLAFQEYEDGTFIKAK
jgi:quercetin 2,3-dioxygenase